MLGSDRGAALRLNKLRKEYRGAVAVDEVSIDVRPGEFLTLLGPSGSGKSTTLGLIAGFVAPTGGEILLDGKEIDQLPPHRRGIGVVFQHYALFPHLTAAGNVAYPLKQRKIPRREIKLKVSEALDMVDLKGLEGRYPRELSGGQQQRVALARALVFEPRLLLMDEPFGALDRRLRDSLQRQIRRLHRELGITFIFVTHDQEEAMVLSERVAIFNAGRIEQIGRPDELYDSPVTPFVAEFLGDSNLFRGPVRSTPNGLTIESSGATLAAPTNGSVRSGAEAILLVRPERCQVLATGQSGNGNTLVGTVMDVLYLGSKMRIEVKLDIGTRVIAEVPARADACPDIGERMAFAWEVSDSVLLTP